jgi:spore germination cell wall hydrolase CwlJ-like protein
MSDLGQIYQGIQSAQQFAKQSGNKSPDSLARQMAGRQSLAPRGMAYGGMVNTDLDDLVRTVIGEAAGEGAVGQQAVAAVIMNRARAAGKSPSQIVHAPNQFEPWSSRADQLRAIDPSSDKYQRTLENISPVLSEGYDPTGGATHFYAPRAQAALGRKPPSWDNGTGVDIGNHRFFSLGYGGGGPHGSGQTPAPTAAPASQAVAGATGAAATDAAGQQAMIQAAQQAAMEQQTIASQASAMNSATQMMNPASPVSGLAALMPMLMMDMNKGPAVPPAPTEVHQQIPASQKYAGMQPLSPYEYSQTRPVNNTGHIV